MESNGPTMDAIAMDNVVSRPMDTNSAIWRSSDTTTMDKCTWAFFTWTSSSYSTQKSVIKWFWDLLQT